jgi:hypothetical protein
MVERARRTRSCFHWRFLCKRCLEVGVDAFGVDQSELGEGLFPIGGDLAFDEAA